MIGAYELCWWPIAGLVALAAWLFRLLKDPNPSNISLAVGGIVGFIAGFIIGTAMFLSLKGSVPSTAAAINDLYWLCVLAGAIVGGLCAGIWGKINSSLSMILVGQGAGAGFIGAVISMAAFY